MPDPIIALLTDFGEADYFVASLKAVIAGINPAARTIDITHRVPACDIRAAAFILSSSYALFPGGTVFLAVVDPGVGSPRRILLVRTPRYAFIAPDNGLLTMVLEREAIKEVRSLNAPRLALAAHSPTFEARDRMAPAAAWLSLGVPPEEFGPRTRRVVKLNVPRPSLRGREVVGAVLYRDSFGNLITNIPAALLNLPGGWAKSSRPTLTVGGRKIGRYVHSYAEGPAGRPVFLINSLGLVEIAVKEGSAADRLKSGPGRLVRLRW